MGGAAHTIGGVCSGLPQAGSDRIVSPSRVAGIEIVSGGQPSHWLPSIFEVFMRPVIREAAGPQRANSWQLTPLSPRRIRMHPVPGLFPWALAPLVVIVVVMFGSGSGGAGSEVVVVRW